MTGTTSAAGKTEDTQPTEPLQDESDLFRPAPPQDRPDSSVPAEPEKDESDHADEPALPRRREQLVGVATTMLRNWPAVIILAAFAAAAMVVPTMMNIATTDDWGYTISVEMLVDEGTLKVYPVVAATAVGQVLWGALFALVFGMSLGVMRLSTVVMVALGGIALYVILRQLGVSRSRSALGMGVWIFNPLTFSLAFSFMTDAHFASVMLMSLAFYIKGLRPDRENLKIVVIGSFLAGFAFLIRQQGALIPFAVGVYLLMIGKIWFRWAAVRRLAAVALLPAAMLVGYYVWLQWFNDVPAVQQNFLAEIREEGWEGTWLLIRRLPIYVLFYAGVLLVPLVVAITPWRKDPPKRALFTSPATYYAFSLWLTVVVAGLYFAGRRNHAMPLAPQFVGPGGFGPPDVIGSRRRLFERGTELPIMLTVVAAIGAIILGLVICRRLMSEATPERAGFWLVTMVGLWQFVGIFPPSYHYINRGVTLDRYLLPVIAVLIIVTMWSLRDVKVFQPLAWLALAGVAVFSSVAERDYLVFMDTIWNMAEYANENGVENDRLDAGSGWDGYHLYQLMLEENITKARSPAGSPWWVYFYAKPTDSSYIVSTDPSAVPGYVRVATREYDQWLEDDPVYVYLMKRWFMPFPVGEGNNDRSAVIVPSPRSWQPRLLAPEATPTAIPDTVEP